RSHLASSLFPVFTSYFVITLFHHPATSLIDTLSLHDALPIYFGQYFGTFQNMVWHMYAFASGFAAQCKTRKSLHPFQTFWIKTVRCTRLLVLCIYFIWFKALWH